MRHLILIFLTVFLLISLVPLAAEAGSSRRLEPKRHYNFLPKEVQCQQANDCSAIQAVCSGWEYMNKAYAQKREELNLQLRTKQKCVVDKKTMSSAPEPACFLHVCVNSNAVKKHGSDCKLRQNYVDHFHSLARSCEEDTDCIRGLAHCGFDCMYRLFNRDAASFLGKWIDTYAANCETCEESCLDRYEEEMLSYMIRCKMKRCILVPKRQIKFGATK